MKKAEYGFGIIGAGNVAKLHAEAIEQIDGAKLIGVTAIPYEAACAFADKYEAKAYKDINEVTADSDIDIVTLCTPSGLHAQQAVTLLNAGKHAIVEKPLAITLDQADSAIEAANRTGKKLGVISQRRFDPAMLAVKSAIDKGLFGKLVLINGHVHYYREPSYYSSSDWRGTWKMDGGGALMNQGIHAVDLIGWFGGPVKNIYANARTLHHNIEVEDTLAASLEFESGALGTLEATTCAYPGLSVRIELIGEKGTTIIEDSRIIYWNINSGVECPELSVENGIGGGGSTPMSICAAGHISQFKDFIEAVGNDSRPAIDGIEGRKAVEIVLAAYQSSRTGSRVGFPLIQAVIS